jgi:hypothetical protein
MAGAHDNRDWLRRSGHGARAHRRRFADHSAIPPAIFIAVVKPDCLHGTLLGPWKDSDPNGRYACLWEPYPGASKRRLPMVIYLHRSLFEPKTVAQTDLLLD